MVYGERFDDALVFVSRLHRTQKRKGTETPYVNHLLAVAALVGEQGGTEEQVVAALLHDAIEDCIRDVPDIRSQIQRRFGDSVLSIVEACTDADTHPKPPWRERKEAYIAHLRGEAPDSPALLVSLADKVHNARSIVMDHRVVGAEIWQRFKATREGTLWYYQELADVFEEKVGTVLSGELRRIVDGMATLP